MHGSVCDDVLGEWGVGYSEGGGQGGYSGMDGEWEGVGVGEVEMWVGGCHFLEVKILKSQYIVAYTVHMVALYSAVHVLGH
jgi:hypothetical protein